MMKLNKSYPMLSLSIMCALFYFCGAYLAGYYYLIIAPGSGAMDIFMLLITIPFCLAVLLSYTVYHYRSKLVETDESFKFWSKLVFVFAVTTLSVFAIDALVSVAVDNSLSLAFPNLLSSITSPDAKNVNPDAMMLLAKWPYLLQNVFSHIITIFLGVIIGLLFVNKWRKNHLPPQVKY